MHVLDLIYFLIAAGFGSIIAFLWIIAIKLGTLVRVLSDIRQHTFDLSLQIRGELNRQYNERSNAR